MHVLSDTDFPYQIGIRSLAIDDADACELVENDSFKDPRYRATREKFDYRLRFYPELCYGLFIKAKPSDTVFGQKVPTQSLAKQTDDSEEWFLVGHAISTRSSNPVISDEDMSVPSGWEDSSTRPRPGSMTAIHSFAFVQAVQRKGLGRKFMAHYVDEMRKRTDINVVGLLCQDYLLAVYESMGFTQVVGESLATFGGGGWYDMTVNV